MSDKKRVSSADANYRAIFEHAAVSLWEEDISRLRGRIQELQDRGVDLRAYLPGHPEFTQEALDLVEVIDVNAATLRLLGVERREDLLGPLRYELTESTLAAMNETILAIAEGRTEVETESTAVRPDGRKLDLISRTYVPPADSPYDRMVVTLVDVTPRKDAQRKAQASAELLQSVIDSSPDSIFVKDTSLRMVLCNTALARAIGREPRELYGKTDVENGWSTDLVKGNPGKGLPGWEKDDLAVLAGATVTVPEEMSPVGGEMRWFSTLKFPLRAADGRIEGLVGIARDITERHRAEAALARERRLFDLMMDNLPDYMYFKDRDSRFIRTSRSHARAFGLRQPSEAVGKTDFDFYREETARQAYEDEQQIIRTGLPLVDIEERETYADRPDTWVLTTKMPLTDEHGAIIGTFGISHDITRRKKLEERNQQLASLVDSSDDAIVGYGVDRLVTVWNRGAERLYGYTAAEVLGQSTARFIPPELDEEARLIREKIARGESVEHFETVRLRKDGSRVTVSLSVSAVRDASNRLIGMASVARDITEQKAVQAQLNRVQRLESLATLSAGISHQFNNIHTIVQGYLDLLRFDQELPPRLAAYVAAAGVAVQRAGDVTRRLQAIAQPPGDPSAVVQLDALARNALPPFEARIAADEVRVELDLGETPPAAGEGSRLLVACTSLLANALDSLLDRPLKVIRVRTGRTKDRAFFEVQDTGCGIPARDLPRLFSPFFSGKGEWAPPGSAQAGARGLGLGLAISSAVVSDYGGRIEVESTEGVGSRFRILLPLAEGVPKRP